MATRRLYTLSWLFFALVLGACRIDEAPSEPQSQSGLIPRGLKASYDTLNGRVDLTWRKDTGGQVQGYLLFRSAGRDGIPKPVNEDQPITDTFFVDTLGGKASIREESEFAYRLKSQDRNANASAFSEPATVRVVPPSAVRTFLTWTFPGPFRDTVSIGDMALVRIVYKNATRDNALLRAGAVGSDSASARIALSGKEGSLDLSLTCDSAGSRYFWIEAWNTDGTRWRDTLDFHVLKDAPRADAGPDTSIDFGSPFRFRGKAEDKFGRIVSREWDFDGAGTRYSYTRLGGGDTVITADFPDARPYLRVTDDDGNVVVDSFHLAVRPRKPILAPPVPGSDGRSFALKVASERDADLCRYLLAYSGDPIADSSSGAALAAAAGDSVRFEVNGLFPSQDYRFRLFAVDSGGSMTAGEEIRARTEMKSPWVKYGALSEYRFGYLEELHAHRIGNRILLFGGRSEWSRTYNPALGTFPDSISMVVDGYESYEAPVGERNSLVVGARIFVMGGASANQQLRYTDNRALSFAAGKWSELNRMPDRRINQAMVFRDGSVYCLGGDSLDSKANDHRGDLVPTAGVLIYDTSAGTWSQGPPLPAAGAPNAALLVDGTIVCLSAGRRFELARGSAAWEDRGGIPALGTAQYCDSTGKAYFFNPDSVVRYDLRTGNLDSRPFLGTRRQVYAVAESNGLLILFGGTNPGMEDVPDIDIYSPALDGL